MTVARLLAMIFLALAAFHVVGAGGALRGLAIYPSLPGETPHYPASRSWLGVAIALVAAAAVVLARGGLFLARVPPRLATVACATLGLVFAWRTIGDFRYFGIFRSVTGTSFASWDTWLYTPLCAGIGISTLWLAASRRNRDARPR